jgi:hypothetical protein
MIKKGSVLEVDIRLNNKAPNKALQLTSQYAVSLRYTLYCRSTEFKRYIVKNKNEYCCLYLY